jgi:hypothetical protein
MAVQRRTSCRRMLCELSVSSPNLDPKQRWGSGATVAVHTLPGHDGLGLYADLGLWGGLERSCEAGDRCRAAIVPMGGFGRCCRSLFVSGRRSVSASFINSSVPRQTGQIPSLAEGEGSTLH